jgi:hypothetical protein
VELKTVCIATRQDYSYGDSAGFTPASLLIITQQVLYTEPDNDSNVGVLKLIKRFYYQQVWITLRDGRLLFITSQYLLFK